MPNSTETALEPGATAGDHSPRAAVPTAVPSPPPATYPRLRAGLERILLA